MASGCRSIPWSTSRGSKGGTAFEITAQPPSWGGELSTRQAILEQASVLAGRVQVDMVSTDWRSLTVDRVSLTHFPTLGLVHIGKIPAAPRIYERFMVGD